MIDYWFKFYWEHDVFGVEMGHLRVNPNFRYDEKCNEEYHKEIQNKILEN